MRGVITTSSLVGAPAEIFSKPRRGPRRDRRPGGRASGSSPTTGGGRRPSRPRSPQRCGARLVLLPDAEYPVLAPPDRPAAAVPAGSRRPPPRGRARRWRSSGRAAVRPYGLRVAERLGADLGGRGVTVVSGLARGIDTAAHRGALDVGGRTIAVLGSGVDVVYPPENGRPGARGGRGPAPWCPSSRWARRPLPHHFPARNRLIAGLTLGTVVVEAAERSGALITARLAGELGREVYAVPGQRLGRGESGDERPDPGRRHARPGVGGRRGRVAPGSGERRLRPVPRSGRRAAGTSPRSRRRRRRPSWRCWGTSRSPSTRSWSRAGSRRARCRPSSSRSSFAGSYAGSTDSGTSGAEEASWQDGHPWSWSSHPPR